MVNKMMKYMTKIGQNTGTFKASKQVQIIAITTAFRALYLWNNKQVQIIAITTAFRAIYLWNN